MSEPNHFYGSGITPWMLAECMESSGIPHVDALRCDITEYAFRKKGDDHKMIDDLSKAIACAERAIEVLKKRIGAESQPELPIGADDGEVFLCPKCGDDPSFCDDCKERREGGCRPVPAE